MVVGILSLDIYIPEALSLKEKRQILQSIKTKVSKKFNVSIAEVGHQDKWQRATLGVAKVSTDVTSVDKIFTYIDNFLEADNRIEIIDKNVRLV